MAMLEQDRIKALEKTSLLICSPKSVPLPLKLTPRKITKLKCALCKLKHRPDYFWPMEVGFKVVVPWSISMISIGCNESVCAPTMATSKHGNVTNVT